MKIVQIIGLFMTVSLLQAQEKVVFQTPPREIMELVDVERAPNVVMDSKKEQMLFYYRPSFMSLSDLNQPEMRLGGLRINPETNISSTINYFYDIRYKKVMEGEMKHISGLPDNPKIAYISFSPDENKIAFTHTAPKGVELWMVDLGNLTATKLTDAVYLVFG
jgi:hypothetical protein